MPHYMFYRERKDFYQIYAETKEKAEEILDNDPNDAESYFDSSEIAMNFTFSHVLRDVRDEIKVVKVDLHGKKKEN